MDNIYPDQNDKKIQSDILKYKEFAKNKIDIDNEKEKKETYIDNILKEQNILNLSSYQNFISSFINPHTEYNRLLLLFGTGAGKTIGSLAVAKNFIEIYKKNKFINNQDIGNIFIMGFTSDIFKRELLNNEYNFYYR